MRKGRKRLPILRPEIPLMTVAAAYAPPRSNQRSWMVGLHNANHPEALITLAEVPASLVTSNCVMPGRREIMLGPP